MVALLNAAPVAGKLIKKNFIGLLLAGFTMFSSAFTIIIANADFKGEWNFNEQKSKLAEGRFRMAAQKLKVSQEGDALVVERTFTSPQGENFTSSEKLTFDGKTAESTAFGNSKKKSVASWSQDGLQLTINSTIVFERDGNQFEVKTVEIWKLIDNGKAISIESTSTSARGTTNNTFVYDKV